MEQEENKQEKMAKFILEMRKVRNLTPKELAGQLGVTDKAVSKWERAVSSPDISLLLPLAKALGVSVGELLNGERDEAMLEEKAKAVVDEALKYSHRSASRRVQRLWELLFAGMSLSFLLAGVVCFICDFALSRKLSWSLLVAVSLLVAWGILAPFFLAEKRRLQKSLLVLTVLIFPYLMALSLLLEVQLLRTMGLYIAAAGLLGLWGVYGILTRVWSRNRYLALGMTFSLCIAEEYGIDRIIDAFLKAASQQQSLCYLEEFAMLMLAALCFGLAAIKRRAKEKSS